MNKKLSLILALLLAVFLCAGAQAAQVRQDEYSDAPATPTQKNVLSIEAELSAPEALQPYAISTMEPTALTVDTLSEIFRFVDVDLNPPARWFPEDVHKEIARITGVNPDVLYMPEFMSLLPSALTTPKDAEVRMRFDIEYEPGRLVVVVLGRETEDGLVWKALKADVPEQNLVRFTVPAEELEAFAGRETLFALLSVRPGSGWETQLVIVEQGGLAEESEEPHFIFSKTGADATRIEETYQIIYAEGESGSLGGADCQIVIVPSTDPIEEEMQRLTTLVAEENRPVMDGFPEDIRAQMALMLPEGTAPGELVAYESTCVQVRGYDEPYGDVAALFTFITPYQPEQPLAALLAIPDDAGVMTYAPLHAQLKENLVEITFSSTVLPAMMQRAGLLLVLSTPLE